MSGRLWTGFIFIILGGGFLLQQAGVWQFSSLFSNGWPLIIVIVGIIQLFGKSAASITSGTFLILIGGLFFLKRFYDFHLFSVLWPLVLIFIGFSIIFTRSRHNQPAGKRDSADVIQAFSLFAGSEIRNQSKQFKGGQVTAIFGAATIDLRDAVIEGREASLDLTAVFGGIELIVPEHIQVEVGGMPILGGWDNKKRRKHDSVEERPLLKVNAITILGGLEIKD